MKETKNAISIDTMFDWNFHFVSRAEGEIYARRDLTRLCLAGGVLVAASKGAFRRRQEHPSERIKPRRQGTTHPVLPYAFDIVFTWGFPFFLRFLEVHVRRATVKSSRWRPRAAPSAGAFNDGQRVWKKSARVLHSRLPPGVKLWLASSLI